MGNMSNTITKNALYTLVKALYTMVKKYDMVVNVNTHTQWAWYNNIHNCQWSTAYLG